MVDTWNVLWNKGHVSEDSVEGGQSMGLRVTYSMAQDRVFVKDLI